MHYIYLIKNIVSGKLYVGRTNNPNSRRRAHFSELRRGVHGNPKLQASFNKHGEAAFSFDVVDSAPEDRIEEKEFEWFGKFNFDKSLLYNCHFETSGGPKIWKPLSEETKRKISEAIKNGTRKYIFDILDDGYKTGSGINSLAKKYGVGGTTLLEYKEEWEHLRGVEYAHPQTRATLERMRVFVEDFHSMDTIPDFKEYGLSKRSIDKYLHLFNLTRHDVLLDEWKQAGKEKALAAIRLVKETGCSALQAMEETGASVTTFYKYLKEHQC